MNVLQRGVRSVLRKPIKSIILLFIVIVMSGLFLGAMASRSASIYTQDATRQAIGATFRIEGNEENRRKRLDQAMDVLGDREGSYGGVTHKWLENGADMVVTDNSFETVKEDDVKKIAQVEGIEEYNLITIATVVNPVNFSRIEDSDDRKFWADGSDEYGIITNSFSVRSCDFSFSFSVLDKKSYARNRNYDVTWKVQI